MYVLGISGSPRLKGNTDILLEKALSASASKGVKTEKVVLNNLKMIPCQECETVKDDGTCKIEDDFQSLYEKIMKADAIIVASPIFFGSLSAQTKIMIDRFQCYWRYKYVLKKAKLKKKKPGAFISVEGSTREDFFDNAKVIIKNFFTVIDIKYEEELLFGGLDEKGDILKHKDYLNKASVLGENIINKA